ncbi:conserved hypothetical protein [Tenacibaculum maritimum]|uniref:hypothetical protein n=1 Tax=Tenacibaculum maritimum TaxID=107401 RepID=UPI0012E45714|nr:hypothetical protein [Tenacibaculum maritimum]CAA0247874.1 conserved hypothetical protein [Tenacibaculum maritimum]
MKVTIEYLETKVAELNKWLQNTPSDHNLYWEQEQKRNYYVNKLCVMNDSGLQMINI